MSKSDLLILLVLNETDKNIDLFLDKLLRSTYKNWKCLIINNGNLIVKDILRKMNSDKFIYYNSDKIMNREEYLSYVSNYLLLSSYEYFIEISIINLYDNLFLEKMMKDVKSLSLCSYTIYNYEMNDFIDVKITKYNLIKSVIEIKNIVVSKNILSKYVKIMNNKEDLFNYFKDIEENILILNDNLYTLIIGMNEKISFKYPKILHLFWKGKLSFLNYLTVLSFNKYHIGWKIKIYTTSFEESIKNEWETEEQKMKTNDIKDYFSLLEKIENVEIVNIDELLIELGIEKLNYIYQSDMMRIYFLSKYGGVYSDFDIIYIKSFENCFINTVKDIFFDCVVGTLQYYPVAFFISMGRSETFSNIFLSQMLNVSNGEKDYQKYGVNIFKYFFDVKNNKKNANIMFLDDKYYLFFNCDCVYYIYHALIDKYDEKTFGIHWFNGSLLTSKYIKNMDFFLKNSSEKRINIDSTMNYLINDYLEYL